MTSTCTQPRLQFTSLAHVTPLVGRGLCFKAVRDLSPSSSHSTFPQVVAGATCGSVTNVTGCSTGCIADRRLVRTDKITIVSMEGRGIDKTSMPAARSKLSCGESSLPSG
ncbi:hypothetical protein IG631_20470 [Alternaria alternata]|nr:hypothetical protein IG631_20470 [Alternaria alternata]